MPAYTPSSNTPRDRGVLGLHLSTLGRVLILVALVLSFLGPSTIRVNAATEVTFSGPELLGRPTNTSITINIVPDQMIEYYYEYGTTESYGAQTTLATATGGQAHEVVINGLSANTRYYYRMRYHLPGETDWVIRSGHSFWTQRSPGSTFVFDITSDSHINIMLGQPATWQQTLTRVAADNPDMLIDLGDTFAMDGVTSASTADSNYLFQRSTTYLGKVSPSAAIFLAPGNHEQQEGWHLDDTTDRALAPPVIGTNAQKKYFLNPVPDAFYSGDTETYSYLSGDQLREDYYAWTWGDALFVVIDPYWYTMSKPFAGNTGGGEPEAGDGDRWHWTLGQTQFDWLKQTLQASSATYKFIFAHHMVGGSDDYVRGGANPANICEWGGYNETGTTYEWNTKRPGWGPDPVHQILVANGVSAFFHGHDHQYGYEKRDDVVYQALPSGGFSGGFGIYTTGNGYTIQAMDSPGHLRVTVTPAQATVAYIATTSGSVNYSYTIAGETANVAPVAYDQAVGTAQDTAKGITLAASDANGDDLTYTIVSGPAHGGLTGTGASRTYTPAAGYTGPDSFTFKANDGELDSNTATVSITVTAPGAGVLGDVNGDGLANSTDALIVLSADADMNTASFCPMNCGDVNGDTNVNSTDALIILSYDAEMTVPFPVGTGACPSSVNQPAGCS